MTKADYLRYRELLDRAKEGGTISMDLDDPCDRAILDVCLKAAEAVELLGLHVIRTRDLGE